MSKKILISENKREDLLRKANEEYSLLKKSKNYLKQEKEEFEEWDSALQDGLSESY